MAHRETHDLGRLYAHGMRYPADGSWPVIDLGSSHEVEEPWRIGRCVVLRLPLTRAAAVIGWWGPPRSYEELLEDERNSSRDTAGSLSVETLRSWRPPPSDEADFGQLYTVEGRG